MVLPPLLHPQPLCLSCSSSSSWPSDALLLVKTHAYSDICAAQSLNTEARCSAQPLRSSSGASCLRFSDAVFLNSPHSMTPSVDMAHSKKRPRRGCNHPSALTKHGRPGSSRAEVEQIDDDDGSQLQGNVKKKASGKKKSAEELHFEAIECYCPRYENENNICYDGNGIIVDLGADAVPSEDMHSPVRVHMASLGGYAVSTPVNESKYLDVSGVRPWICDGDSSSNQLNGGKEKNLPQKRISFNIKELQIPDKVSHSKRSGNVNVIDGSKNTSVDTDNAEVKTVSQDESFTREFTRKTAGSFDNYQHTDSSDNYHHSEKLDTEDCQSLNSERKFNVESTNFDKTGDLSEEQKIRMELNKAAALARRHMRRCEDAVAEAQVKGLPFPNFESLLVERSWSEALSSEFQKPYMDRLYQFVSQEAAGRIPIYPPPAKLFNAFNSCPLDKVKVVIIGQDPYHSSGQAMGLCFSVEKGSKLPSSLTNMFLEIQSDLDCEFPSHGNLEKWAHQGVLLLNTVLTVRDRHANSHAKKGWELFTDAAIRIVVQQRSGVVFLLWGNQAQEKLRLINKTSHHILKAFHPSGLSAHKGFFKCRHFSKTNQLLLEEGLLPIDWQL
ncbi:hypothetical protein L7F22_020447 [Adiantum nelumboides]|nr:hypothetical protein [Adiantum nelumboides]